MEFRDYVAVGSFVVALGGFIFNWARARGWEQKSSYRDELARFVGDEHATSVFSADARESAKRASAYLSLELAERARRQAAKRAKRATQFWPRALGVGATVLVIVALLVVIPFLPREPSSAPLVDVLMNVYLFMMAAIVLLAGVVYVIDLRRLRNATTNLQKFFTDVASAKRLDAIDALSPDEQKAIDKDAPATAPRRRFWPFLGPKRTGPST